MARNQTSFKTANGSFFQKLRHLIISRPAVPKSREITQAESKNSLGRPTSDFDRIRHRSQRLGLTVNAGAYDVARQTDDAE